jgi:hypothetical protein
MSHRDGRRRSSAERIPAALSEAAPSTRTEEIVHARLGMREALAAIALGDERSAPDALFALLRRLGRLVRFAPVLRDAPTARVQSTHVSSVKVSPKAFQLSRLFFPDDSTRRGLRGAGSGRGSPLQGATAQPVAPRHPIPRTYTDTTAPDARSAGRFRYRSHWRKRRYSLVRRERKASA